MPTVNRSGIEVRPTRPDDVRHLPGVERSAAKSFLAIPELSWIAGDEVMPEQAHDRYRAAGTSWVAAAVGPPVGFLCAEAAGDALHIWEIAVHEDWQGRGLGRRLVAAATAFARTTELIAVTLTTFRDVPWNEPFYGRLGFHTLAPAELGQRLEAILAGEARRGLPGERRCAMRLALGPS
jgi:GNAT superfamily N-acetyltransferase